MRRLFLVTYSLSGVAALIYEVTWTRTLTLQIGHNVAATSTVLAAFMGGLAGGSALAGRFGGTLSPVTALRAYAVLEIIIAGFALLLPLALWSLKPLLVALYGNGDSGLIFPLFRVVSSLLLLSLPATAMGATFPIASRWFVRSVADAAADAGRLYAANTIGAAGGALFAGFVLLPALGLRGTTWVAVAFNLTAALVAWLVARRDATGVPSIERTTVERRRTRAATRTRHVRTKSPGRVRVAAAGFGLSGFAALALQIVYTRLLASIVGPTTYAFSVVVAVFITGLAAGSTFAARFAPKLRQPAGALCLCLLLSVTLALAAAAGVDPALLAMGEIAAREGLSFGDVLIRQAAIVAALVLPMAMAFGAAFPLAVAVGARAEETVAADLGLVYAANTAGAIIGALLAGFVFIPSLGLLNTIRAVTVIVAIGAMLLLVVSLVARRSRLLGAAACALVIMLAIRAPSWDQALLASGVYKYASMVDASDLKSSLTAGRVLFYREGATATVSVREAVGSRSLSIDGKVDASDGGDMLTQRLLAHLPLLLHPQPRQVAIIGLGSGVTLGSALVHPIARADAIEISPEVVDASSWFEAENHQALADPRTRLVVADGRSHLMLTRTKYDVIIAEPSNPWMAGVASLFTREFFQAVRDRLTPGGIFCQWAHTYDISEDDLRSIIATFLTAFPDGTMWLVGDADVLLVGSTEPLETRLANIVHHWNRTGVASDLRDVHVLEPFSLLSLFVAHGSDLARYAASARVQTDDLTQLEYTGPRSVFGSGVNRNVEKLHQVARSAKKPALVEAAIRETKPEAWRDRGWMFLAAEAHDAAWRDFTRAVELDPRDSKSLRGLIRAALATSPSRAGETRAQLERLARDKSNFEAAIALSRLLATRGALDEAVTAIEDAAINDPNNVRVLEQLASVLADGGDLERLQPVVARLRQVAPGSEVTRYYAASLAFLQGQPQMSVAELDALVRENPTHALAQNLLGAALASLGDRDRARSAFEASLRADPLDAGTYTNLATLELESGNPRAAAQRYAEALTLDPASETARRGLTEAAARR